MSVAGFGDIVGYSETTVTNTAPYDVYSMTIATAGETGGIYILCWAHNPSQVAHYSFPIGVFTLHGPTSQSLHECTLTVECSLTLAGTKNFANTNAIRIMESTLSCGSSAAQFDFTGMTNPKVQP